jgi:hypothetical protein
LPSRPASDACFHIQRLADRGADDDAHEQVRLVPLDGRAAIAGAVLAVWAVADQLPAQDGATAVIPQQALRRAVALASDGAQAAERSLLELEIGSPTARALAATLAQRRQRAVAPATDAR